MRKSQKRTSRRRLSRKRMSRKRMSRKRMSRRKIRLRMTSMSDIDNALFDAVKSNNLDRTRSLLDHGANPNVRDKDNNTPLHEGVSIGSIPITNLLLERGANPNVQNSASGYTPLMLASFQGLYPDLVNLLLKNPRVNPFQIASIPISQRDPSRETALTIAEKEVNFHGNNPRWFQRVGFIPPYDRNVLKLLRERERNLELYKMIRLMREGRAFLKDMEYPRLKLFLNLPEDTKQLIIDDLGGVYGKIPGRPRRDLWR